MAQIFWDSDGVVAHFDQHCFNNFGRFPREMKDPEMWELIHATEDWWPTMPLMPGAHDLWNAVKHLNPIVLTGCPRGRYEHASEHKKAWWKAHFDHDAVITCLSKDKSLHMQNPGDILVDDMYKNIKKWRSAGGVGILHKTSEQTLIELTDLGVL